MIILGYDLVNHLSKPEFQNRNNLARTVIFLVVVLTLILMPQDSINKTFHNKNASTEMKQPQSN